MMSYIFISFLITTIGAVPLGLVNLSVLNSSIKNGKTKAMQIAAGSSFVEMLYAFVAIWFGSILNSYLSAYPQINYLSMLILIVVALVFFTRRNSMNVNGNRRLGGFGQGILLNLLSVQVFFFWIVAISYLITIHPVEFNRAMIIAFLTGVFFGKMTILWLYSNLAELVESKAQKLSGNINKIIGSVLIISVFIQWIKI